LAAAPLARVLSTNNRGDSADDLHRLRVLGAIFPDFDDTVANNNIPPPSAGKPILPIGLRHFLLAAIGSVTQIGFEMLETF